MALTTEELSIEEGNKLIAEFDGYLFGKLSGWISGTLPNKFYKKDAQGDITDVYSAKELEYHSSWDWLMPVIAKIKEMKHNPNCMAMGTTLERDIEFSKVTQLPIYFRIDIVWLTVVNFIKWYNQN